MKADPVQDAFRARVDEALEDLETIEDYEIVDTDDPEVINIIIKGRLKEDISRPPNNNKEDSDYDRAMKGFTSCTTSHNTSSNN